MKKIGPFFFALFFGLQNFATAQQLSLNFDGTDDAVEFPLNDGLLGDNFTIEGWMKCVPTGQVQCLFFTFFDPQQSSSVAAVEVRPPGVLRFVYRPNGGTSGGDDLYGNKIVEDNLWHHFAFVKEDNRILKIYVDGVLDNISCIASSNIIQPVFTDFGRNRFAAAEAFRPFKGNLDDVKIWAVAKSNHQIFSEFEMEHAGKEPGLYDNYKFDEQSDTIFDCSAQKVHGIRVGDGGSNAKPQFSTVVPVLVNAECEFGFVGTDDGAVAKMGSILLFPNPAAQEVTVELADLRTADVELFSSDGKLAMQFKVVGGTKKVSTAQLPTGVYQVRATSGQGVSVAKLVKK